MFLFIREPNYCLDSKFPIQLINKCLLRTYCVLDTLLGTGDVSTNNTNKCSSLRGAYSLTCVTNGSRRSRKQQDLGSNPYFSTCFLLIISLPIASQLSFLLNDCFF